MNEHPYGACRDMLGDLNDYIDGELDQELCQEIERHMAGCENCRVVVDTLRKTVLLYHALPEEPLPQAVEERLIRQLNLTEYLTIS